MLYNGHLVIADTFLGDQPSRGQTLLEKPLYSGHIYSRHLLQRKLFWSTYFFWTILPVNSGHSIIGWEKQNTCMFLIETFLYFNMKLII